MSNVVYTPIIDGNKSVFLYKNNMFDSEFKEKLTTFVKAQSYRDGMCVSGREIPRKQLWFQKDGKYFCDSWKNRYDRWESVETYPDILNQVSQKIFECEEESKF